MNNLALYIHVPFCPKVCHYCDFAVLKAQDSHHHKWWKNLQSEIELRMPKGASVDTLYFGGGTPSLLSLELWQEILPWFQSYFNLEQAREITIECNPESLDQYKLDYWNQEGVHRYSLGIQTFDPGILNTLGRSHTLEDSFKALELLSQRNLNYSLDLMFGLPGQSKDSFLGDLELAITYKPSHISFYGLTIEPNTLFHQRVAKGEIQENEFLHNEMYEEGVLFIQQHGFHRYELSNFSLSGKEAIHNQKYWALTPYYGFGPGAHSLVGDKRSWNHRHLGKWQASVVGNSVYKADEFETLTKSQQANEYIWLSLRQAQGLNLKSLKDIYGQEINLEKLSKFTNCFEFNGDVLTMKQKGWRLIDEIATELFVD